MPEVSLQQWQHYLSFPLSSSVCKWLLFIHRKYTSWCYAVKLQPRQKLTFANKRMTNVYTYVIDCLHRNPVFRFVLIFVRCPSSRLTLHHLNQIRLIIIIITDKLNMLTSVASRMAPNGWIASPTCPSCDDVADIIILTSVRTSMPLQRVHGHNVRSPLKRSHKPVWLPHLHGHWARAPPPSHTGTAYVNSNKENNTNWQVTTVWYVQQWRGQSEGRWLEWFCLYSS